MENVLDLVILLLVGGLSVTALLTVAGTLFPRPMAWTRKAAEQHSGRAFLVGLVNTVFVLALAVGVGVLGGNLGAGALQILASALVVLLVLAASLGLVGMVDLVGERLFPESSPLGRHAGGAGALVLGCLAPYLGWFALLPYLVFRGLGGFLLGWFAERAKATPEA
jgi:hypothetical protein